MDSLIPEEFAGRYVTSGEMMCATTMIYPSGSVVCGGTALTADELRRKYGLLRWFKKLCGSPVTEI